MKNVRYMTIVITCLALLGAMQAMAVNYPQMKPARQQTYGQPMHVTTATAPTATFHSTSPIAGTYSGVSTLNANGTVNEDAYGVGRRNVSGPRRSSGGGMGTPDDGPQYSDADNPAQSNPNGSPLGGPVLPLLLLAFAYMCLRPFLKRKRATQS